MTDDSVIKLKETTPEFRKGFMSAMNCVLDMGKGSHTYHSLLGVIESIIALNKSGSFFPEENCKHEHDGLIYTSNPPQNKCKKCGEFYR